jgi:hypothetical protein
MEKFSEFIERLEIQIITTSKETQKDWSAERKRVD